MISSTDASDEKLRSSQTFLVEGKMIQPTDNIEVNGYPEGRSQIPRSLHQQRTDFQQKHLPNPAEGQTSQETALFSHRTKKQVVFEEENDTHQGNDTDL